jgi:hypothetical protein
MSVPVPLPISWHIYTTIHCPSCEHYWNFDPAENGKFKRTAWCPNPNCVQHGHIYELEMNLTGVEVVRIVR